MDYQFVNREPAFPLCLRAIHAKQNTFVNSLAAGLDKYNSFGENMYSREQTYSCSDLTIALYKIRLY